MKRERLGATLAFVLLIAAPLAVAAASLPPGEYRNATGDTLYVGTQHELPDSAYVQYLNASSGTTGPLPSDRHLASLCAVHEERRIVHSPLGVLGVSLYYRNTAPAAQFS